MAGQFYEQLDPGTVFQHAIRRTVTEMDNVLFTALTHNPAQLHLDEEYCREHTEYGQRIVNSAFTLGLVVGISVGDTTLGTTLGNLGMEAIRFPKPVFHGDTLRVETEVISRRESTSRPNAGLVVFEHRSFNQRQEMVATIRRTALMLKQPAA
jgi:acyl dehydratase